MESVTGYGSWEVVWDVWQGVGHVAWFEKCGTVWDVWQSIGYVGHVKQFGALHSMCVFLAIMGPRVGG